MDMISTLGHVAKYMSEENKSNVLGKCHPLWVQTKWGIESAAQFVQQL